VVVLVISNPYTISMVGSPIKYIAGGRQMAHPAVGKQAKVFLKDGDGARFDHCGTIWDINDSNITVWDDKYKIGVVAPWHNISAIEYSTERYWD
jgi:hypothetical protein